MSTPRLTFGSWTILTAKSLISLNAIQFVKDGEAFGTKSEGADCFESLEDDDDFFKLN